VLVAAPTVQAETLGDLYYRELQAIERYAATHPEPHAETHCHPTGRRRREQACDVVWILRAQPSGDPIGSIVQHVRAFERPGGQIGLRAGPWRFEQTPPLGGA
jgi:hypothetical protein